MTIRSTFAQATERRIWSVYYPEEVDEGLEISALNHVFRKFTNEEYVTGFVMDSYANLDQHFWAGFSADQIIDFVFDDVVLLEEEFRLIQNGQPTTRSLDEIFQPFHNGNYVINPDNEIWVKAKGTEWPAVIRIYGYQLNDGTIIIADGVIKLTRSIPAADLQRITQRLRALERFCLVNGIHDVATLVEYVRING